MIIVHPSMMLFLNHAYIVVCTFCIKKKLFQTIKFGLCHVEHPPICSLQYKLIVKICKLSALHISVLASCPASRWFEPRSDQTTEH